MSERELDALEGALRAACPELELRREELMSKYTTFRIGGPAALTALPATEEEAGAAVKTALEFGVKPFFLGNGSNLLVSDQGYRGFLIKLSGKFGEIQETSYGLSAGGAVSLARLANAALDRGLAGLAFASGIPGTLGGAIVMNAGAYGGEMARVLHSVTVMDATGNVTVLPAEACGFSYRRSVFMDRPDWLILGAELALSPGSRAEIRAEMDALAEKRRAKQPLDLPSAGSTFKRPPGYFAAALIEQCGCKGLSAGGAQVSPKHAGFVVNTGGASCADVLALVETVKRRVLEQTGVALELEVRTLGV